MIDSPLINWLCGIWAAGLILLVGLVAVMICGALINAWRRESRARRREFYRKYFTSPERSPMKNHPATKSSCPMSRIALAAIMLACGVCMLLQPGCSTFGNGQIDVPLVGTPYQAGRTFVFVDTVSQPFQPAEVDGVIDQVYALAKTNLDAEDLLDEVVQAQIDAAYADATEETRALIYNVYAAVMDRITYQISLNTDLPELDVLSEFFRGVNDALAIYQSDTTVSDSSSDS